MEVMPRSVFNALRSIPECPLDLPAIIPTLKLLRQDVPDEVPSVDFLSKTEHPDFGINRSVAESAVRAGMVVENTIELVTQASTIMETSFSS
jgi:hypothetical protein